MKVGAIVVSFNPPPEFESQLASWMSEVELFVIVENGSDATRQNEICEFVRTSLPGVEVIRNRANIGIAAALNQGFARLIDAGCELAFAFDHDSRPRPGMAKAMLDVWARHGDRGRLAIVAPVIDIPSSRNTLRFLQARGRFLFRRVGCQDRDVLEDVTMVITSGALYNLKVFRELGPFRADFFIDYVDTEYCLRVRARGYNIMAACHAHLEHGFGKQEERRIGPLTMHPSYHSALRWYYISRNRVPVSRQYAWRFPHWFLFESLLNVFGLVRLILFEDNKVGKLRAIVLGTWDGLLNRLGPASPARLAALGQY